MSPGHDHAAGLTGSVSPRGDDPLSPLRKDHAGSVVLELGGDTGALILHAPAALHGHEIEISPVADAFRRTHSLVRERHTAAGVSYAAVYPQVPAGQYTVWRDAGTPAGTVIVAGGQVARFRWPE